ncbi:MAG: carboxypeptidase regulatory-like domain-containing protein, partial [Gammaproteobacteria bacterium]|nr:carboxypeptidase regulatory-like domain-containing protein [Gammaproteobacteria bacterium]
PEEASEEEMIGLQTLTFEIPKRLWADKPLLEFSPVIIHPYHWFWWLHWCRSFTIRGKVTCADGSPVPGAEVCAYDVDWWFFWSSKQQVGCATTDVNGLFEISFRWCCGWWPWWWLQRRSWQLDDVLSERIANVLNSRPELKLSQIDNQPGLAVFDKILGNEEVRKTASFKAAEIETLPNLREQLLKRFPVAPELEAQRIWPWHHWSPWQDCTPDITFIITQDCETVGKVILDETIGEARWNISNPLDVNLIVNDDACCRPVCQTPPCDERDCLIIDTVCGSAFTQVGGNPGASATPAGYLNPGSVPVNTHGYHRPFAGRIPVLKNPADLAGVDYYEIEVNDGSGWGPLPSGAAVDFKRRYWMSGTSHLALFPFVDIAGHRVVETRYHYESTNMPIWPNESVSPNAWWLSSNYSMLVPIDSRKFNDGTYRFRVVGWQESAGTLTNSVIVPVCSNQTENEFVLTFDNRITNASASHAASHNCGQGVHLCTTEPDTHIKAIRVDGVLVKPCATVDLVPEATLEIDFMVRDSDRHLAFYHIAASWGLNQSHDLLNKSGAVITPISAGAQTGWAPGQSEGNYGTALSPALSQGPAATAPHWEGGEYRLSIPMSEAFPEPCCYQLELWAFKRTVVGSQSGNGFRCSHGFHVGTNGNKTEYSIGVGVCPSSKEKQD